MNETSRTSRSRSVQGARPSTFSSPCYGVRPRIALSAVVLPAPLGPMSPRMRPSSTRKSTLSSAIVVPKALRRRRASMQAMASALLLCSLRRRPVGCGGTQQFLRCDAEPLNSCGNPGPLFGKKLLAFALQQQIARAGFDEHAETSFRLDKLFVNQLLIGFENRQRIDPIFGRNTAHGRQRIAFVEHAVEYHVDDTIAKVAINRLTIVPFTRHSRFQIDHFLSYSDIVNYNTMPTGKSFFDFLCPLFPPPSALGQRAPGDSWRKQATSRNGSSGLPAASRSHADKELRGQGTLRSRIAPTFRMRMMSAKYSKPCATNTARSTF